MTTKQKTRLKRQTKEKSAVKAAVTELTAHFPHYARPIFQPARYKILYGGRGGGRSWSMARALLIRMAERTTRVLCAREFQTSIKDSVHQLLTDQITLMGLNGFRVTDREIRHENGSFAIFEGLRVNIKNIKSLEGIDICWVEEAERISKESWDVLIPTIRKDGSEIWISFNPDQEDDNTYQRFIVTKPKDSWIKKVSWRDNPFLSQILIDEKDHAYATDPDSAEHVWGGELRTITAAQILAGKWIVEEFTPFLGHEDPNECEDLAHDRSCSHAWGGPYQGLDFGFAKDPTAGVRLWIYERRLYVEHELWRVHLDIDFTTSALCLAIPGFQYYVTRGDSARPDSISYLKRHGLPRVESVKKHPGSVEDGIAHLRSYDKIIIHPRCKHFKAEAKNYSYKVDERSGDVLPEVQDKWNHLMDASRYALAPMIKPQRKVGVMFARPANGNGNGHSAHAPVIVNPVTVNSSVSRLAGLNGRRN